MRKILFLVLSLVLIWSCVAQALETTLVDVRTEIFKNAQGIKTYFATTRDPVLLNSLWSSSIMAISQLDAYFSMLGIFNSIKKENIGEAQVGYLVRWLKQLQDMTDLNIKSLDALKSTTDARSKVMALKLKNIFNDLRTRVAKELQTVMQLQESVIKK